MPQKVLNQIKWLCREIPKVEWSGILFYTVEGSIKDPKNMVITLQDILPMHKGSATYTEYTFDSRVLDYLEENEDLKLGHIHSHNTMNVYFSGTDWSELEDNSPNHNFYLSLIVNNFMDFCAKVAFIAESTESQYKAKDENGNFYSYNVETEASKKLVTYDCNIFSPEDKINVSEDFSSKVNLIIEEAAKRPVAPVVAKTYPTTTTTKNPSSLGKGGPGDFRNSWDDFEHSYGNDAGYEDADDKEESMFEDFSMFVLNTGNDISSFKDLEDILDYYKAYNLTPVALRGSIVEKYLVLYNNYFTHVTNKDTPDTFTNLTEGLIDVYETEVLTTNSKYVRDMLSEVINGLKRILSKFNSYEPNTI